MKKKLINWRSGSSERLLSGGLKAHLTICLHGLKAYLTIYYNRLKTYLTLCFHKLIILASQEYLLERGKSFCK